MKDNRILVTRKALEEDPHADWNAFINVLAMTQYDDLTPVQRIAHLAFWYESEVLNGGHLQYFNNRGIEDGEETIQALDSIGVGAKARILERGIERWMSKARKRTIDLEEYVAIASEEEFNDLDAAFCEAFEEITKALERYLARHEADFIVRDRVH
jgi:hypothetical protein